MSGLSTTFVSSKVAAMRTILGGANVSIRHNDRTYSGVRVALDQAESVSNMGAIQSATSAVRLLVSELGPEHPKAGDVIEVKEPNDIEWVTRVIVDLFYDATAATMKVTYGEQYG